MPMGVPRVRAWVDAPLSVLRAQVAQLPTLNGADPFSVLALSGGGEHGAFGAGLLCGWSETGHRPTFSIVTGISTGALMAPFAFLGSAYDQRLKALYTEMSFHNLLSGSPVTGLLVKASTILDRYNALSSGRSTRRCWPTLLLPIDTGDGSSW